MRLRICLVAWCRFPIREPFAGGLESFTHMLATELAGRGHEVSLFAAAGSDPGLPVRLLPAARSDPAGAGLDEQQEDHAYRELMHWLAGEGADEFDVVHNNSLHHLPVAMAPSIAAPMITTLHTPPLPLVEAALRLAPTDSAFAAVSEFTARTWQHILPAATIRNGVDLDTWRYGAGGGPALWSGRIVPEKAPHEAIDACRAAGVPLVLVGPVHDVHYFHTQIEPRLGGGISYVGHLDHDELRRLLRRASVALVTPIWDEPWGLVASEAMACGTPVAAYARGGLPEVVGRHGGALARGGDVADLSRAVLRARRLPRAGVRRHAEQTCSLTRMVDAYERCYAGLLAQEVVA